MTTAQERKQQERQARRRRIQQAARTVFAERGYAKTSIEQVARQASLSVGAIYLYFRSKEDLYISLIEETLESFDAELGAMRTRSDLHPTSRLQAAWSHLTGWAVSDVEGTRILRLIAQPGVRKQLSDEVAVAAAAGLEKIRYHLATLVSAGVEAGHYRAVDAQETADLLWALFIGVLETTDARKNLGLDSASFTESAQATFAAIEGGMRTMVAPVTSTAAEAAAEAA
jgi:TetR/AcrR family transcriptional regulator